MKKDTRFAWFADLLESSIKRRMGWPFYCTREEAERAAEAEIATLREASDRFAAQLKRIPAPPIHKD